MHKNAPKYLKIIIYLQKGAAAKKIQSKVQLCNK